MKDKIRVKIKISPYEPTIQAGTVKFATPQWENGIIIGYEVDVPKSQKLKTKTPFFPKGYVSTTFNV